MLYLVIYLAIIILAIYFRPSSLKLTNKITREDLFYTFKIVLLMAGIMGLLVTLGIFRLSINMNAGQSLTLVLFLSLVISPAEEIFYRGIIGSRLNNHLGTILGIILTSIIFGLAHYSKGSEMMILAGISGLFLSMVFLRTRSIVLPVILHTFLAFTFSAFIIIG